MINITRTALLWAGIAFACTGLMACGESGAPLQASSASSSTSSSSSGGSTGASSSSSGGTITPSYAYAACYDPSLTTASAVAQHGCTWWHEALLQQARLNRDLPLQQTHWHASHNSYNSTAYPGVSSTGDPNHSLSLADQLRLDIQSLELDLHWYLHAATGGFAPVLCHALGAETNHQGCASSDRHFSDGLAEIASYLAAPENADVVLMLDLEDQLQEYVPPNSRRDSAQGHADAIAALEAALGNRIYRPTVGGGCQAMPLSLSKATVLAAGKQVIVTSGCNNNGGWNDWVFDIGSIRHQKGNDGYAAPPDCGAPFFAATDYTQRWTRVWHDSTQLSAQTNPNLQPIDAPTLQSMIACGLHMSSLDLLTANDARAEASIWSWAPGQPAIATSQRCAQLQSDNHWYSVDCAGSAPYACRLPNNTWAITAASGAWASGFEACAGAYPGSQFAVPRTGREAFALAQILRQAAVWLRYTDNTGMGNWLTD